MRQVAGLGALILAAVLLGGCAERTYSDKTLVEWSRGRQVGKASASEPVALAVAPDGDLVALAWVVSPSRGASALHLVTVDGQGTILVDMDLPVAVSEPTDLRLALTNDGYMHLTWIQGRGSATGLFYLPLTVGGQPQGPAQRLSDPAYRANGQAIAALPGNEVVVVWSDRQGLKARRISGGATAGPPLHAEPFEAPDSHELDLQLDGDGQIQIVWQRRLSASQVEIDYITLDPGSLTFSGAGLLSNVELRAGASSLGGSPEQLNGPALALVHDGLLAAWSVGQARGSEDTAFFQSIVPGQTQQLPPRRIDLPASYQPDYDPANGPLPYRQLAAPLTAAAVANRAHTRTAPATVSGISTEVPLALSLWVRTAWSPQLQPGLVIVADGEVKGFQIVGWSRYPSIHPTLETGADGSLYLAWIDAAGREFPVYLATTAPRLRESWDELNRNDMRIELERFLGRLVSALGLALVALSWLVLPGFGLIVALFVVREDSLDTSRGRALLFSLVGLHWAGKYLLASGMLTHLPRMSDLPLIFPLGPLLFPGTFAYLPNELRLPALIAPAVPYLVPSLTLLAGAIVTRLAYLGRKKHRSLVPAYVILAAVDLFCSLQIYALAHYDPVSF
jgi:hypothetical protein